ncbi:Uncharacterized protein TCM_014321 [Theobroma cacao]|uniref:Uncharacterized protein n=1 Tax=Theobroma cacao TaxID=3641 RepID=A0A061FX78_THECC|nr:Uncharacterized protein TCM_014321 [Theobroma cacao]
MVFGKTIPIKGKRRSREFGDEKFGRIPTLVNSVEDEPVPDFGLKEREEIFQREEAWRFFTANAKLSRFKVKKKRSVFRANPEDLTQAHS